MDAINYLFYGLGQVAYAVALSDGKVQKEEEKKMHEIITEGLKDLDDELDYTEIIFKVMDHDHIFDPDEAYQEGIQNMKLGGHLLNEQYRKVFVEIIEKIAAAFPPKTEEEMLLLERFRNDLPNIR